MVTPRLPRYPPPPPPGSPPPPNGVMGVLVYGVDGVYFGDGGGDDGFVIDGLYDGLEYLGDVGEVTALDGFDDIKDDLGELNGLDGDNLLVALDIGLFPLDDIFEVKALEEEPNELLVSVLG